MMPKEYTIRYSTFSRDDVKEIRGYLSQFYPSTRAKFMSELKRSIDLLKTRPKLFEAYSDNPRYRKMPVLQYVVFYTVNEDDKSVSIFRILHGKEDREKHL